MIENDENLDLYMIEHVLPILFVGFEQLAREVELYQNSGNNKKIIKNVIFLNSRGY